VRELFQTIKNKEGLGKGKLPNNNQQSKSMKWTGRFFVLTKE